jgi:hypothetical protein
MSFSLILIKATEHFSDVPVRIFEGIEATSLRIQGFRLKYAVIITFIHSPLVRARRAKKKCCDGLSALPGRMRRRMAW